MATPEQSSLEELLAAAASDPADGPEFLKALLDSTVIVPGLATSAGVEPGQTVHFAVGQSVQLAPMADGRGSSVQPFYSSEERLQDTLAVMPAFEHRFLALKCRDLWELTAGATLVLNPHSAHGKEFLPGEIAQLLSGSATMTEQVIQVPTQVLLGAPAHTPDGMEAALVEVFGKHREVTGAYLGWKVTPATADESYLLVVVGAPTAQEVVAEDLARALLYFSQSHPIDVMYKVPGADNPLAELAPFYRVTAR